MPETDPASRPPTVHAGWYLVAFEDELEGDVTPLYIGTRPLVAVCRDGEIGVYDAICPHHGANLGYGGVLARGGVICPFHGKAIHLGERLDRRYCVREYPVLRLGGAVFARLSDAPEEERGFTDAMRELASTHTFVTGFRTEIAVRPDLVIENAFDVDHFTSLHKVPKVLRMALQRGIGGELGMQGVFVSRAPGWANSAREVAKTQFHARAFSPTVVVSELGNQRAGHVLITGAVPTASGCVARVAYALAPDGPGGTVNQGIVDSLMQNSKLAFEQDRVVWEHMDVDATPQFDERDESLVAFREFAAEFTSLDR